MKSAIVLVLAVSSVSYAGLSRFDTGTEGWTAVGFPGSGSYVSATPRGTLEWNADGFVSFSDNATDSWFFSAPAAFLGNQSEHLGGILSFDVRTTHDTWTQDSAVVLHGAGLILVAPIAQPQPLDAWIGYAVALDASSFRVGSPGGVVATHAQLQSVMSDLQILAIPGEFANGLIETTDLDNVVLPEPATLLLVSSAGLMLMRRR